VHDDDSFSDAMARLSTFEAREALLRELKAQHAIVRDKPARLATLAKQIEIAETAKFPQPAIDALHAERQRMQQLEGDEKLDRKIETLSRWITVEREYQALFGSPVRKAKAVVADAAPKRRGRPPKVR
jgi:hypothetical protein